MARLFPSAAWALVVAAPLLGAARANAQSPPDTSRWPAPAEPPPPTYAAPFAPYPYPYPYPVAVQAPQHQDPYLLPELPPRRRRYPGLFAGGITAVTVGVGTVLLGAYLAASAAGRIDIYCDTPAVPCAHKTDGERMTAGAILMAVGGALGVAGVPMWILGSEFVTLPRGEGERRPAFVPELRVGAGPAAARASFGFSF